MSPDRQPAAEVELPAPVFLVNVMADPLGAKLVMLTAHIPMTAEAAKQMAKMLWAAGKNAETALIVPDGAVSPLGQDVLRALEEQGDEG